MEHLQLTFDSFIGTRLFNVPTLSNLNIKKLLIDKNKFKTEDLEKLFDKIGTKREKFLLNFNKKNKGEKVIYQSDLNEEESNLYEEIEDEKEKNLMINYSHTSCLEILVDRIKEKQNKKNKEK